MLLRARQFISKTYAEAQREQREHFERLDGRFDWETPIVLITVALALTWRHYYYAAPNVFRVFPLSADWAAQQENAELVRLMNWTFAQTAAFLLAPLACCIALRRRPADFALKLNDVTAGWRFYLPMYLLMLPILIAVSQSVSFQHSYPFYQLRADESLWPRFVVWELLYAWQFIALEFFFRGFMVHGLKRSCGFYSVLVMMVPYCMIHFGKPPLETLASIIAGIAMGVMSLGTRSIWMGAALHIAVAWSMDVLALWTSGRL